jgi:GTP cyclohydrolase I
MSGAFGGLPLFGGGDEAPARSSVTAAPPSAGASLGADAAAPRQRSASGQLNGPAATKERLDVLSERLAARTALSAEENAAREERMAGAVRTLLECIGEDPDRDGLSRTPLRFAKALMFFTSGYGQSLDDMVNQAIFDEKHNEMVLVKDIDFFSMCEHHVVPFFGRVHIAYIPREKVIGLSKLGRITEMFARRLQVQERLTTQICEAVMEILQPRGVGVVVEATHMCMVMRGVQKTNAKTTTSSVRGVFQSDPRTRQEFFAHIHSRGGGGQ